ncbi:hypothetical protein ACVH9Z_09710 [Rhodococcus opacus]|uniref:Cell division protein FtsL n=2 Tax=Rhodococcus opacus TaxID=37919 RepID=A0A1B1K9L3_RHOOP|nr:MULTISPECIES: hypothetical protein [Rhodococcus]ELB87555.1 hypothetical protein Rwratislav_39213 [Rhodococcus wratislaviensis IFP 2016]NHU44082.1 hypothetical protein [Rhodococcus sp. A14]ANS29310.1 hypothetical protein R1CP_23210 [Rhodococcus opacus]EKT80199.1 hypothetical protein WSS_A23073 [Rhodococcus opacus M213]MBA8964194.1 cell division protein FtsB [Rhodococcus opacus]
MTVQVSSTEMRPARAAARTGAAERAYKKRTQRAAVHSGSAIAVSGKNRTGTLTARIPFVATILVLLAMGLAMTLLLTTRSAEDSYQLSAARAHNQSLAEEKAALERDVETANSAPKLAEEAAKLGMVPANDPARLVVHPDGSVEVVGKPAPASGAPVPPLDVAPPTQRGNAVATAPNRGTTTQSPRATPQPGNGTEIQAQGEQLVPVIPSTTAPTTAPPSGGRR